MTIENNANAEPTGAENQEPTQGGGSNGEQPNVDEKTFTQSEVDALIQQRVARATRGISKQYNAIKDDHSSLMEMLQDKGIVDKESIASLPDPTEAEQAKVAIKRLENELATANAYKTKHDELVGLVKQEREERTILSIAANAGAQNPELILDHMIRRAGNIIRSDEGELDETSTELYVKKFLTENKNLLSPIGGKGAGSRTSTDVTPSNGEIKLDAAKGDYRANRREFLRQKLG